MHANIPAHASVVAALLLGACPNAPPATSTGPEASTTAQPSAKSDAIPTSGRAIATFRLAWSQTLPKLRPELTAWGKAVDDLVQSPSPPLEVRVEPCRDRFAFIRKNIPEIDKLVVAGELKNLDRDGPCPVVFVAGGMNREAEFILDEHASVVLLGWLVPEG